MAVGCEYRVLILNDRRSMCVPVESRMLTEPYLIYSGDFYRCACKRVSWMQDVMQLSNIMEFIFVDRMLPSFMYNAVK